MTDNTKFLIASVLGFLFSIYALGYLRFYEIEGWWVMPTLVLLTLSSIGGLTSIIAHLFMLADRTHADD